MTGQLIFLIYAGVCAFTDLRFRRISIKLSLLMGVIGIILGISGVDSGFYRLLFPLLPGVILATMSFLSRGAIGMGDAIFILVAGCYFTLSEVIMILALTWILSAMLSLFIIVSGRYGPKALRKKGVPYVTLAFPVAVMVFLM